MTDRPPRLSALATAFPDHVYLQDEVAALTKQYVHADEALAEQIDHLFAACGVRQRRGVIDLAAYYSRTRSTGDRMLSYRELAYALGHRAVSSTFSLAPWQSPAAITDLSVVSCTGYAAPGLDIQLARDLGIARDTRRLVIGHMGCFGAMVGLRQALAAVRGYPGAAALVLCVELTSLHFMPSPDLEVLTSFGLFGDAAAAFILSCDPSATGPAVIDTYCAAEFATADQMSWTITDTGFVMELSPRVPASLRRAIAPIVDRLLAPHQLGVKDIAHWIIHPGGPAILEAIQRKLELTNEQMAYSHAVLRNHGNCSSATVLVVLDALLQSGKPQPGEWGVMMAFGPGLTLETALLQF